MIKIFPKRQTVVGYFSRLKYSTNKKTTFSNHVKIKTVASAKIRRQHIFGVISITFESKLNPLKVEIYFYVH